MFKREMKINLKSFIVWNLILIGIFLLLMTNLYSMTKTIEGSIAVSALVERGAESSEAQIEANILKIEGVSEIDYQSKEEEFDFYKEMYADSGSEDEGRAGEDQGAGIKHFVS